MKRKVGEHYIGISIPVDTNQNGVSLLKAALLATVEEQLVGGMRSLHPKLLPDDSVFEVNIPPEDKLKKPTMIYPLYAMIKGTIRYEFDDIPEPEPEE